MEDQLAPRWSHYLKMDLINETTPSSEESFYANSHSLTKDPLKQQLAEISQSFRAFAEVQKIKKRMKEVLKKNNMDESDFIDFKLDTMKTLESLRGDLPVETFLKIAFLGCIHAMQCFDTVAKTWTDQDVSSMAQDLTRFVQDALSVMANVLKERGWSLPDVRHEKATYQGVIEHFLPLTDMYLRRKLDYQTLKGHEETLMNFMVIEEVEEAFRWLRDVFEDLRARLDVGLRHNEFLLNAEKMEGWIDYGEFHRE